MKTSSSLGSSFGGLTAGGGGVWGPSFQQENSNGSATNASSGVDAVASPSGFVAGSGAAGVSWRFAAFRPRPLELQGGGFASSLPQSPLGRSRNSTPRSSATGTPVTSSVVGREAPWYGKKDGKTKAGVKDPGFNLGAHLSLLTSSLFGEEEDAGDDNTSDWP